MDRSERRVQLLVRQFLFSFPLFILIHSGELLLDQSRYQDAIEKFDKAIDIELAKSKDGSVKG